jgi:hypothetical protein
VPGDRGGVDRIAGHEAIESARLRCATSRIRGRRRDPSLATSAGKATGASPDRPCRRGRTGRAPGGSGSSRCRGPAESIGISDWLSRRDRRGTSRSVRSGHLGRASRKVARSSALTSAASGPRSTAPPATTMPDAASRSSATASGSSPGRSEPADTRRGRRPMARSRSTVRFRAIVWSHAASDPVPGSYVPALFHNARKVSCTTSSATCRSALSGYSTSAALGGMWAVGGVASDGTDE